MPFNYMKAPFIIELKQALSCVLVEGKKTFTYRNHSESSNNRRTSVYITADIAWLQNSVSLHLINIYTHSYIYTLHLINIHCTHTSGEEKVARKID